jgi:hypothetical protein
MMNGCAPIRSIDWPNSTDDPDGSGLLPYLAAGAGQSAVDQILGLPLKAPRHPVQAEVPSIRIMR